MKLTGKQLVLICFLFFANNAWSQKVEVMNASGKVYQEGKKFAFIEPVTDTKGYEFVGSVKATIRNKKSIISTLFFAIKEKANKLGANCYKVQSFSREDSLKDAVLILDCYVASDSLIDVNFNNHEKNVVFIFGEEKKDPTDTYRFNLNDEKKEITSGSYYRYDLREGEELKINKGGFTGASMWINWKKNKPAIFLTLSGFQVTDVGLGGGETVTTFSTGGLNQVNISLGYLLTQLLIQSR